MHCAKELFSLIFVAALATSAAAADARKGETLAKRWCATCHVVAADQQVATTQSPAVSTIARNPDFSEATLAFFPEPTSQNAGYEFVAKRGRRFSSLYQNSEIG